MHKKFVVINGHGRRGPIIENEAYDPSQRSGPNAFFCKIFEEMMTVERCRKIKVNDPLCTFCERF